MNSLNSISIASFLLSGSVPFSAENTTEVYENIKAASFMTPAFLSEDVLDLLKKLLTPHSLKRATMMDVMQ